MQKSYFIFFCLHDHCKYHFSIYFLNIYTIVAKTNKNTIRQCLIRFSILFVQNLIQCQQIYNNAFKASFLFSFMQKSKFVNSLAMNKTSMLNCDCYFVTRKILLCYKHVLNACQLILCKMYTNACTNNYNCLQFMVIVLKH